MGCLGRESMQSLCVVLMLAIELVNAAVAGVDGNALKGHYRWWWCGMRTARRQRNRQHRTAHRAFGCDRA